MYHVIGLKKTRGIKNVTLKVAKKCWVSRYNKKSSTGALQTTYPRRKSKPTNTVGKVYTRLAVNSIKAKLANNF